ncbi:MAG: hypothetical protein IPH72_03030 [Sandaracinaceae bacterium]|nr:hypothetical protein [Sandaracinaceae bacterium]
MKRSATAAREDGTSVLRAAHHGRALAISGSRQAGLESLGSAGLGR